MLRAVGRDITVIAMYLPPGEVYTNVRANTMADIGRLVKHLRSYWVIVGDWNQDPAELAESGYPVFLQGTIVDPGQNTCRQGEGSKIDYVLAHPDIAPCISIKVREDVPWGPHLGLDISIDKEKMDDVTTAWRKAKPMEERPPEKAAEHPWEAGDVIWDRHFKKGRRKMEARDRVVQVEQAEGTADPELTDRYRAFSKRAEVHQLSLTGALETADASSTGRGQARIAYRTAVAPRRRGSPHAALWQWVRLAKQRCPHSRCQSHCAVVGRGKALALAA